MLASGGQDGTIKLWKSRPGSVDMAHDVFISYSSKDQAVADAVCAALESRQIACWIAPRDIAERDRVAVAIPKAISECRVMVLVFSSFADQSRQVRREVHLALEKDVTLIPFRIEDIVPNALGYYLSNIHWLDAVTPPLQEHLTHLADKVEALVAPGGEESSHQEAGAAPGAKPNRPDHARRSRAIVLMAVGIGLHARHHTPSLGVAPTPTGYALLKTLRGHQDGVSSVAFSPDGRIWRAEEGAMTMRSGSGTGRLGSRPGCSPVTQTASPPSPSPRTAGCWRAAAWTTRCGSGT